MNEKIKEGARQLAEGISEEAKDLFNGAKEYVGSKDFREEVSDLTDEVLDGIRDVKDAILSDDFPEKAKAEGKEVLENIKKELAALKGGTK